MSLHFYFHIGVFFFKRNVIKICAQNILIVLSCLRPAKRPILIHTYAMRYAEGKKCKGRPKPRV